MAKRNKEIRAIKIELAEIQERLEILKKEGITVDPKLQAALDQCKSDVSALAAQKGGGTVDVQPSIDAVTAIDAIAKAALSGTGGAAPSITSITPSAAPIGGSVSISGTGFGATQGSSTLTFNGTAATPVSWSDTAIVASIPPGATSGPVVVTVNGTPNAGFTFTVQ